MLFMSCVCHAFASVHCCLVVACCEMAGSWLSFMIFVGGGGVVTFPCGILGQVQYLILSTPDLCHLSYSVANMKVAKSRIIYSSFTIFVSRERSGLLVW